VDSPGRTREGVADALPGNKERNPIPTGRRLLPRGRAGPGRSAESAPTGAGWQTDSVARVFALRC
jgi:hypothetical protein